MNTDIRLRLSFRNHPKTKKLRFRLGPEAVLSFIWLLMFAAESRSDGELVRMDEEDLALAGDWVGDPREFVDVLVQVGYLDVIEGGWRIHDWAANNPWAAGAAGRSAKAKKAAQARWGQDEAQTKKQPVKAHRDAPSKTRAKPRAKNSNAPSPSPSPSPVIELPEWIDRQLWLEYEQHRREIMHTCTPTAARRIVIKLERFMTDHLVDPNKAIELAIERGWRGVFPERILEDRNKVGGQHDPHQANGRRSGETAASRRAGAADRKRAKIKAVS